MRQASDEQLDKGKTEPKTHGGYAPGPYAPPGVKRIGEVRIDITFDKFISTILLYIMVIVRFILY